MRVPLTMPLLLLLLLGLLGPVVWVRGVSILGCLNTLDSQHYLQAGNYTLVIQNDCNLVLYEGTRTKVWESGAGVNVTGANCSAKLLGNGILAVYDGPDSTPIWESNGATGSGNYFMLDATGRQSIKQLTKSNEYLYAATPNETLPGLGFVTLPNQVWNTQSSVIYMLAGYQLPVGTTLNSGVNFILALNSTSCVLELREANLVLWSSASNRSKLARGEDCHAVELNDNGILQIVGSQGGVVWATNVSGPPSVDSYVLYMSDKGNVSIYDSLQLEKAIWTTHHPEPEEHHGSGSLVWIAGVLTGVVILGVVGGLLVWGLSVYYGCCLGCFNPAGQQLTTELMKDRGRGLSLSLAMVRQATKRYQKLLGEGGFGKVFYGKLADGREVAVKVLSPKSRQGKNEFYNEIKLLSVVHHQYLVSLVGYCLAWNNKILVYEYMSGGDLFKRLHGDTAVSQPLTWSERTRILMQVAEGLEYLHDGCNPAILHRDVKSTNILLDDKMCAKVADFGLSKLVAVDPDATHIVTGIKGTHGYLDPEYCQTEKLTDKTDVYAFGVLLMEILTAIHPTGDSNNPMFIGHVVQQAWKAGQILERCDPNLGGLVDEYEYIKLMKLSLWCIKLRGQDRPSMGQVVQELRNVGLVQVGPLRSINGRQPNDSHDFSAEDLEAGGSENHATDVSPSDTESASSRSGGFSSPVSVDNFKPAPPPL